MTLHINARNHSFKAAFLYSLLKLQTFFFLIIYNNFILIQIISTWLHIYFLFKFYQRNFWWKMSAKNRSDKLFLRVKEIDSNRPGTGNLPGIYFHPEMKLLEAVKPNVINCFTLFLCKEIGTFFTLVTLWCS